MMKHINSLEDETNSQNFLRIQKTNIKYISFRNGILLIDIDPAHNHKGPRTFYKETAS